MSDDVEPAACERCKKFEADIDTPDGRWVCFGCYHAIFNELMRERTAPLVWSSERPKVVGWYWHRARREDGSWWVDDEPWMLDEASMQVKWIDSVQFAGPIPTPLERDAGPIAAREPASGKGGG